MSRDDVAAVLAAVLAEPRLAGATFYLNGGDVPIASAAAALAPELFCGSGGSFERAAFGLPR